MTLRGSLKTMPVDDLFEWLERRKPSGELTLDRAQATRRFHVSAGAITGASSTAPAEYLGQVLINAGVLSEDELRAAYASQRSDGILLGKILTLGERVPEARLREALDLKIREGFYDALSWSDGDFQLDDTSTAPRPLEVEISLPIAELRAAGRERAAAWQKLRAVIPSDEQRFWMPDPSWLGKAKPGSPSALILTDVQRGLSVREICLARHSLPFPIYQRLADLMAKGILSLDRRAEVRAEADTGMPPQQLIEAARGRAKGGDRAGALAMAKKALAGAPGNESIRAAYQQIERSLFADLSRVLLTQYRVPTLQKSKDEIARTPLSAEERYLVDRIDGRWDLLSLMRVSPLREVEALITFRTLADKGLISLG